MITDTELNQIKCHLNRSSSTIFVIGQGIDSRINTSWENKLVHDLYSDDLAKVKKSWKELLEQCPERKKIPFIGNFTRYVKGTSPIQVANFYVLNTCITADVSNEDETITQVVNLNGMLHQGINDDTGVFETASVNNIDSLMPTFIPEKNNYEPYKEVVSELEQAAASHGVRSVFFIGVSGKCPIVESIFNQSILRTIIKDPVFKCVINLNETFMDEEADLVIRADATEFLEYISKTNFLDGEGYFND